MTKHHFPAKLDTKAKMVTILCSFLILGIIGFTLSNANGIPLYIHILNTGLVLLPFICYGLKPSDYEVSEDKITIRRLFKNVVMERSHIEKIEHIPEVDLKGVWRMMGIGGLFGYMGKFGSSRLGRMTWYATDLQNAVLITTNKGKILITPENPEEFIRLCNTETYLTTKLHDF